MNAIDSCIVVAALFDAELHHAECWRLLDGAESCLWTHGLAEAFATMTGGRAALRVKPQQAAELLTEDVVPCLHLTTLAPAETVRALTECSSRGVQGGAVYDYLHLAAARKAKAEKFFTLNVGHFQSLQRSGDPEIVHP